MTKKTAKKKTSAADDKDFNELIAKLRAAHKAGADKVGFVVGIVTHETEDKGDVFVYMNIAVGDAARVADRMFSEHPEIVTALTHLKLEQKLERILGPHVSVVVGGDDALARMAGMKK